QVQQLDIETLSARARVDLAVYTEQVRALIAHVDHRGYERPMNSDTAFWTNHQGQARRPMSDAQARAFLEQLRHVPRYFEQHVQNMRTGLARGFAPPAVSMAGREGTARAVAQAADAAGTGYLTPFTSLPETT